MSTEVKQCENCGADCTRDEVDVGVGNIYGPWHCLECGWTPPNLYDGLLKEDGE